MLDARVFALGIFANQDCVNVVIRGFVTGNGFAGSNVRKEIECTAESEVKGDVTFSYRCLEQYQYTN